MPSAVATSASIFPSVIAMFQFSPRDAVPALPGAAKIAARRRLRELPRERVFARAAADDENPHQATPTRRWTAVST